MPKKKKPARKRTERSGQEERLGDHVILGSPVMFRMPAPSIRMDLLHARGTCSAPRYAAAALALTWPRLQRKLEINGIRYDLHFSVAALGGQVIDYLHTQGANQGKVHTAGSAAWVKAVHGIGGITDRVEEEEGNSEPTEGSAGS